MFKYLVFAALLSFCIAAPSFLYPAPAAVVKVVGPAVLPAPGPVVKVVGPAVLPAPVVTKVVSAPLVAAAPLHPWW